MYRALVFVALALAFVSAEPPDAKKCLTLADSPPNCCKALPLKANVSEIIAAQNGNDEDKVKECRNLPQNCAREICIAQKLGYATPEATMDKKPARDMIKTEFGLLMEPEVVQKIVQNCIDGDLSVYGPEEICDFVKLAACTEMQIIFSCTKWDEDSSCEETKNLVDECQKIFPY